MIEGKNINLRAREDEDAEAFHRWFNDPEMMRLLGNAFPAISMSQQRAVIDQIRGDASRRAYSIVLKDGTLIGNCDIRAFNWTARSCEVGIAIGERECWGKGYGGEAVGLLLQIAFDGLNMHKVWLTCADYNERGLRAYRRIGFREDGRLRDDRWIDGQYHDTIVMSILEAEYRARATQEAMTDGAQLLAGEPLVAVMPASTNGSANQSVTPPQSRRGRPRRDIAPLDQARFLLTLQKTYYEQGFFNIPAQINDCVNYPRGPITLRLDDEATVKGRVDRTTNPNGTPRIYGGAKLRDWFQNNFQMKDNLVVECETGTIRLHKPTHEDS